MYRIGNWRNLLRLGLLATGVYLWYGGRLGPPPCSFSEVGRHRTPEGMLQVTIAADGTPTAQSIRRQIEHVAQRHDDDPWLRIHIVHGTRQDVSHALQEYDAGYVMRHSLATYERSESDEMFIDTHRVDETNRIPVSV